MNYNIYGVFRIVFVIGLVLNKEVSMIVKVNFNSLGCFIIDFILKDDFFF